MNPNNNNHYSDTTPGLMPWPKAIDPTGRYGLAGEFVRLVSPHTEADENAILVTLLTFAGNAMGRNFYIMAGPDQHCGNLYTCLVGNTGSGRKGSAISAVEAFFRTGPYPPSLGHRLTGISTGQAIVYEVHDDIYKSVQNKKTGDFERMLVEKNIAEKRLLINLPEFQQCLANMRQPDSILSSILRAAWDDKPEISTPAKTSRAVASGALISMISAISRAEFLQETTTTDAENGMLNRMNMVCSRRSKLLPQGGKFSRLTHSDEWADLQKRFNHNIAEATPVQMERDDEAQLYWGLDEKPHSGMYRELNHPRPGLYGSITARAPQIMLRMALITAVINGDRQIRREHLEAAYEIWRYCDHSARYIFSDMLIDNGTALQIVTKLREMTPEGFSRTDINRLWKGRKSSEDITQALQQLSHYGLARHEKNETAGRPMEMWFAI